MKKNIEVNGIAYELRGDKYYPTLSLPAQNNYKIGKYGLLHFELMRTVKVDILRRCTYGA